MEYFYIKRGSINPTLRIELINDGKFDFMKNASFNNAIQNADVTFTMRDEEDNLKVKAPASIVFTDNDTCVDRYIIEYKWKERDTKTVGTYNASFTIKFKDDLYEDGVDYPSGDLIVPIQEELKIMILK